MREYFNSRRFKITVALLMVLVAFLIRAIYTGGAAPMLARIIGFVTTPLQALSANVTGTADEYIGSIVNTQEIKTENEALKEEIKDLKEQLLELERFRQENQQFRQFLGIKEENPDFDFVPATVIARGPSDRFGSFTIDKGSSSGIAYRDPVITEYGLVGIVSEVGTNYCKVTTILDVALNVGAVDARTRDSGIVTGAAALAEQGLCKMTYLDKQSGISPGDLVITSGVGGLFPKGLLLGSVIEVDTEPSGLSLFAAIKPASEVLAVKDVFVITNFLGQGELEGGNAA